MAAAASDLPAPDEWVASAPGLAPDAVAQAQAAFRKHGVDHAFLDFLSSPAGLDVLSAWRDTAAAREAEPVAPPAAVGDAGTGPHRGAGRQRVDRRVERPGGNYFRHPEPPPRRAPTATAAEPAARRGPPTKASRNETKSPATSSSLGSSAAERSPLREAEQPPPLAPTGAAEISPPSEAELPALRATPERPAVQPTSVTARALLEALKSLDKLGCAPAPQERYVGVVKSFAPKTGYGFIRCPEVAEDVFVRQTELPQDCGQVEPGTRVEFTLTRDSQKRPQAKEVAVLLGDPPPAGAAAGAAAPRFHGQLKSVGEKYGFIECPEAFSTYGRDVYVAKSALPAGEWRTLQYVTFEILVNQRGEPQAKQVVIEASSTHSVAGKLASASADASEPEANPALKTSRW